MKIYLLLMTVFFFGSASYAEEKRRFKISVAQEPQNAVVVPKGELPPPPPPPSLPPLPSPCRSGYHLVQKDEYNKWSEKKCVPNVTRTPCAPGYYDNNGPIGKHCSPKAPAAPAPAAAPAAAPAPAPASVAAVVAPEPEPASASAPEPVAAPASAPAVAAEAQSPADAEDLDKLQKLQQDFIQRQKDLRAEQEKLAQSVKWHQEELGKIEEARRRNTGPLSETKVKELTTREEAITARLKALGEKSFEHTLMAENIENILKGLNNKINKIEYRNFYDQLKKGYYDSKFLLTDIETLQNAHGLNEVQLSALKEQSAAHLEKTLLGNFLDTKIKEEYRSPEFCSIINSDRCQEVKRDSIAPLEQVTVRD